MKAFRRGLRWLVTLGFVCLCWRPALGLANPAQPLEVIRERMETGLALFVAGQSLQAAEQFEAGYAEYPYSAFLFNAGVCYEKLARPADALAKYRQYLKEDPNAPDIDDVSRRVARLEAELGNGVAGVAPEPAASKEVDQANMRSLVVIETEPAGAPVRVFRPKSDNAPRFVRDGANPDWQEIATTVSPTSLSLSVGLYHILVDRFSGFNASDTQLRVSAGHVHHFKANLSQGVFMAFLRVSSNVKGAHVWLDHNDTSKPEWGTTPYGELVPVGEHTVFVQAPGFEPAAAAVTLESGERREVQVALTRVDYGFLSVEAGDVQEAYVTVDGKPSGTWRKGGAALQVRVPAGKHELVVEADGRKDFEGTVHVPRGQILPVKIRLIPKYPRGAAWAQAAISAGLIGTGIVLGTESQQIVGRARADQRDGSLQSDDVGLTKGKWFAIGADVAFAGGAVLAGLATWNFLKDPLPESSLKEQSPEEFDDPLRRRPTAWLPTQAHVAKVRSEASPVVVNLMTSSELLGLQLGGRF